MCSPGKCSGYTDTQTSRGVFIRDTKIILKARVWRGGRWAVKDRDSGVRGNI